MTDHNNTPDEPTITRHAIVGVDLAARTERLGLDVTAITVYGGWVVIQLGYQHHAHLLALDLGMPVPDWSTHGDGAVQATTSGFHEGVEVQVAGYVPVGRIAEQVAQSPDFADLLAAHRAKAVA